MYDPKFRRDRRRRTRPKPVDVALGVLDAVVLPLVVEKPKMRRKIGRVLGALRNLFRR